MHDHLAFTRITVGLAAAALVAGCTVLLGGCTVRGGRSAYPAAAPVRDANVVEAYAPASPRQPASAYLLLPGSITRQLVNFDIVNGMAVMEGDILLGDPATLLLRYGQALLDPSARHANTVAGTSWLWPGGQIPYEIDASVNATSRSYIAWAAGEVSSTELTVRPRVASDTDYVVFRDSGASDCSSYIGRIGGPQTIEVSGCGRGSIAHEILHAAGFHHEQSRNDRDQFVTIMWDQIAPGHESNFRQNSGSQDIGTYDYGSIMHYSARAFSRTGSPTIVPKVPNAPIGQRDGLSQLDRAAVTRLYGGAAPSPTPTPTPNPTTPTQPQTGSFAGSYSSGRGAVTCTESGSSVNCQYPGGLLFCTAAGAELDCAWSGGGAGRAHFTRQTTGVLDGTYGDLFSSSSRGEWDLVPSGTAPPPAPAPGPTPAPVPAPAPAPGQSTGPGSLSGNFTSTRGPMICDEKGAGLACTFTENGTAGRLDCWNDETGLKLACTWATYFPRPASGRATLTRQNISDRTLTGTWGYALSDTGAGTWTTSPQ